MAEGSSPAPKLVGVLVAIAVAAGLWFFFLRGSENEPEAVAESAPEPPRRELPSPVQEEPEPEDDFDDDLATADTEPEPEPEVPLPALDQSDQEVREAFEGLIPSEAVRKTLTQKDLVRRAVVTIDNLTRDEVAVKLRAVDKPDTPFAVTRSGSGMTLGASNFQRYEPYVDFVATLDPDNVVNLVDRYAPLLDQAYADLGFPDRSFRERAVEVIDHLLEVPQPEGPVRLEQPNVVYEFADPDLEGASAGHKLLLRMGPANASRVLDKLREIRGTLTSADT